MAKGGGTGGCGGGSLEAAEVVAQLSGSAFPLGSGGLPGAARWRPEEAQEPS